MVGNTDTAQPAQGKISWLLWLVIGLAMVAGVWYFFIRTPEDVKEKMKKVREAKALKALDNVIDDLKSKANVSEN